MRNVTITVDEEVARWARIWAAEHGTSMSKMLGELLREAMDQNRNYAKAMRRDLGRGPLKLKRTGRYPSREVLHDRPGLR